MSESTERREEDQEPLTNPCLSTVHRSDMDRLYGRFREQDESLGGVRTRVTVLEQRVGAIEDRLIEQRGMLVEVRASTSHVEREMSGLHDDLVAIQQQQRRTSATLERFSEEQCQRALERTESIHRITRLLIGIFAVLGVLSVSLASLLAMADEEGMSLLGLVLSLFGFGGG